MANLNNKRPLSPATRLAFPPSAKHRPRIVPAPPSPALGDSQPSPFLLASFMSAYSVKSGYRDGGWPDSALENRTIAARTSMIMASPDNNNTKQSSNLINTIPAALSRKFGFERIQATTPQFEDSAVPSPLLSRESTSTASDSTDSSPTTTTSTFDSPIIVESSPDSSPESPSCFITLPSPKSHMDNQPPLSQPPFLHPMFPPAPSPPTEPSNRRAKNLKNLSLRLPDSAFNSPLATAPIGDSARHVSEPSSPVRSQSRGSRRRPPNLTIQTPGFQRPCSSNGTRAVPATPSIKHTLRHIESSPSLNSILSPTHTTSSFPAPLASNQFQLRTWSDIELRNGLMSSNQNNFNSNEPLIEFKEEDDCPISRESRKGSERGYPDGPIRIYDSGLYLYLEPSREEASKFDVVFNVAKEVNNPFKADSPKPDTVMSVWKATLAQSNAALQQENPATACSEMSFKSAFETLPCDSPTTPKADPHEPEYIHVPWDHNSEILDDLFPLCDIIDDRISKGKKVLIHCQLGVSRSASLVIAYGLYKNPHLDFNTVYGRVKERSCWVGPNMSLIYQLTDFRTKIRGGTIARSPIIGEDRNARSPATDIMREISAAQDSPPVNKKPALNPSKLFSQINPFHANNSNNRVRRHVIPRPLPLREKFHTFHTLRESPRQEIFPHRTQAPAFQMDLVMQEAPGPSFFSPKATEFVAPFLRTTAGDLAQQKPSLSSSIQSPGLVRRPSKGDPRSPQKRVDPIIMRSIDEFL